MNANKSFEQLIEEAITEKFSGWDLSYLNGRWDEEQPSWDYKDIVSEQFATAISFLDMGTGGGEFLRSLQPLPSMTYATEAYTLNVPIARKNLIPLGVEVVALDTKEWLPFSDNYFDLIINRHDAFNASEAFRILKAGGKFITQQVGEKNNIQLNEFLTGTRSTPENSWTLKNLRERLEKAGFREFLCHEEFLSSKFHDIGAIVFYLKVISWQLPDFDVDKYKHPLQKLHKQIEKNGFFEAKAHRFFVQCIKAA